MTTTRYHRQTLLPQIGPAGQTQLGTSRALLIGAGALGSVMAEQLARAGLGFLRLVDRDIVEWTNLQRQVLFAESDAQKAIAKAEAAARRLGEINSSVEVEPIAADVWAGNIEELAAGCDLILDGTDNVQTRYLINDASVKTGIPWIHGACVAAEGRMMAIIPGKTACLRCVYPTPPAAAELPTCDTAGVLAPAAAIVASLQVVAAIKILTGQYGALRHELIAIDAWSPRFRPVPLAGAKREDCPCCGRRQFELLKTSAAESAVSLCGRNAVQIRPAAQWQAAQFDAASSRLQSCGDFEQGKFFARCRLSDPRGLTLTLFRDGRLMVDGTTDHGRAKSICSRFIGT
ncbi:MAG TPA: ThiF family adenylyltransferase [Tepidisphaeraceae bacterium]|nr:ThiF family adenylyltransferase [Tepidisphaeraceae bacterium]